MSLSGRRREKRAAEPTIALINIVFLMLVFFMVAGSIAPSPARNLRLVDTAGLGPAAPADALVLTVDGALRHRGAPVTDPVAWFAAHGQSQVRLLPDRAVPATRMVEIARALRQAGAERVLIVTERGLR